MSGFWQRLFGRNDRGSGRTHRHHFLFPASLQTLIDERPAQLNGIAALVTGSGAIAHEFARRRINVTLGRPCHHSTGYPGVTYIARPSEWNAGEIDFLIVDSADALEEAGACYPSLSARAVVMLRGNDAQYPADSALVAALHRDGWRQLPYRDGANATPARLWYRDGNFLGI